jgi:hypothetical protein
MTGKNYEEKIRTSNTRTHIGSIIKKLPINTQFQQLHFILIQFYLKPDSCFINSIYLKRGVMSSLSNYFVFMA